jgi:hypothetical protein
MGSVNAAGRARSLLGFRPRKPNPTTTDNSTSPLGDSTKAVLVRISSFDHFELAICGRLGIEALASPRARECELPIGRFELELMLHSSSERQPLAPSWSWSATPEA